MAVRVPLWAHNGRELFYLARDGALMAVAVRSGGTTFAADTPVRLFSGNHVAGSSILGLDFRAYDVAPDGQRFLMIKEAGGPRELASMVVVLNAMTGAATVRPR